MKQIILFAQWIIIFLILSETWIVFKNMRKRMHHYLFLNCFAMLLCSVGSLLMLFVETEEAYFIALMLSWAGRVGVAVAILLFCIEFCESKLPGIITLVENGFALVSYVVIATTKKTGLFYKDMRLEKEGEWTYLQYVEGPWCVLWNLTITIVILTCLAILFRALFREKNIQKRGQYKAIMLALLLEIIVGYVTVLPIGRYYDFNQLGFFLSSILILFAIFRNNLMDTETMAKEYIIDELSAGVIAMNANGTVAYYNKQALQIFPEIESDMKCVISQIDNSIHTGEPITVQDRIYNFEERQLVHKS